MKTLRFDPTKHGLARWLGPLAAPVMDWLWEYNEVVTVRTVVKHYRPRLNYNTAATTLDRLASYGILKVTKLKNTRHYAITISRVDWETQQINAIIDSLSMHDAVAVGDDGWGHGGWE